MTDGGSSDGGHRLSSLTVVGVCVAFAVVMFGTTLPTPLYPLYRQTIGFSELLVTIIYAVYAVGVLAALLLLGTLSDQVGRRPMLLAGIALSAASAVALLAEGGEPALFVARICSGLSAGLFTGTATAYVIDLGGSSRRVGATLLAAVVNTAGLGLGPLVSGIVSQYVGLPLRTVFVVDLALLVPATVLLWRAPETVTVAEHPRLTPTHLAVPPQVRARFVQATLAGFASFVVLGFFSAVGPAALGEYLGVVNRAVVGTVVFSAFLATVVGVVLVQVFGDERSLPIGCGVLIAGMGLLAAGLDLPSLTALVLGAVVGGLGAGLAFRAGLSLVGSAAPAAQRGEVTSAYFTVLYVGISLPVVGVGIAAQYYGLQRAGVVTAGVVAALAAVSVAALTLRSRSS